MSTIPETTPAIQRMVEVLLNDFGGENTPSGAVAPVMASAALATALDVEEMAQAMQSYAESKRIENPAALGHRPRQTWEETSDTNRQIFRERAAHLRSALLGGDS